MILTGLEKRNIPVKIKYQVYLSFLNSLLSEKWQTWGSVAGS